MTEKLGRAVLQWVEGLEDRRLLSGTLNASQPLLVFNAVKGSSASATETLTITDTGSSTLTLGTPTIVNDSSSPTADAARFSLLNAASAPTSLTAGQSFTLQVNYTATAVGLNKAFLDLPSNDPANPLQQIQLHGIGTAGLGGSNQPSLTRILTAYDIPTNVGEADNATVYPNPPGASSQEVNLQRLIKAGAGPVTIQVLASFDASGTEPYTLGTYTPGNSDARTELFHTLSSEYQSTYIQPQGATTFDPGTGDFGFYFVSNIKDNGANRIGYSEDALNTWDATNDRKFRFFPLETSAGVVVPNSYVMTSTEWNSPAGYDFTNVVAIVSNVQPAGDLGSGAVLSVHNAYAVPGSSTVVFNRIQEQNATLGDTVHETNTLTFTNTGSTAMTITSLALSSTAWTLTNAPATPYTLAAGAAFNLAIKFIATSEPSHSYNQTAAPTYPDNGGLYTGTLTINSNAVNAPAKVISLAGYWQKQSENQQEPSLQTIANLMLGYGTTINATPIPELSESESASNSSPTYYGEEVVSSYWAAANTNAPVAVEQLAAFHTQGQTATLYWYNQGSGTLNSLFTTASDDGQSLFPLTSSGALATGSFSPSSAFGLKAGGPGGNEFSDDSKNAIKTGGGHHMRFFPVRDASGNLLPNTYLVAVDYGATGGTQNFDFQDNVYLVSNIRPAAVPAAPTDLQAATPATAAGSTASVMLQWDPATDATLLGYDVYRGTSATGTFTLLTPSPITAASYVDTSAPAGASLFYRVTTIDKNGASLPATADVVTPGGTVSSDPLTSVSIAETPVGTVTVVTPGSGYNVTAGGPGVGANSDGFRFLYATQTGDFDVAVQVQSITVAGTFATAGIMARTTLDAASPDIYIAASPVNFRFKYRTISGATTNIAQAGTTTYPNVWVRLKRVGNTFAGYYSTDGKLWTQMSSITLALPTTLDLGLAVASNNSSQTTTAVVRNYGPIESTPSVPAAPTTLTATGTSTSITLNWSVVSGATGYNVYSSSSSTGTFSPLTASPITTTTYADTSALAAAGGTVYYRVTAVDAAGESPAAVTSGAATPAKTGSLSSVGVAESPAGSVTVITAGSGYNVTAGGPGIGGTSDGFQYLYTTQTGDFDFAVQVQSITVAGTFATAGILARTSLDPAAANVFIAASPVNYRFKYRTTAAATETFAQGPNTNYATGVWVRLTRVGNVFTGYYSPDGTTWTNYESATVALPTTLDLGLAVASNNSTQTTTAVLRSYGPTTTPAAAPAAPTNLTAAGTTGGISISWSAVAGATGYDVYSSSSSGGTYTLLTASPITATSYADNSPLAAAGGTVYYQVVAINAAGVSPAAATSGQAITTTALPATLTPVDINSSAPGTTTTNANGTTTVTAGGPGVGGTSDGFRFLYQQVTGDFDVAMQVQSITVAGNYATAGIMARASLSSADEMAYMSASPANYRFKDRGTPSAAATIEQGPTTNYATGVWVRLTRVGNVFTGYYSSDGTTWTEYYSATIEMPQTIYLGVGVASNNSTQTTTAVVDDYGPTIA